MSRPTQMHCSKCKKNITMAGSLTCGVCFSLSTESSMEDFMKARNQPVLCDGCFYVEHNHNE